MGWGMGGLAQGGAGGDRIRCLGQILTPVSVGLDSLAQLRVATFGLLCITRGKKNIFPLPQVEPKPDPTPGRIWD